MDLSAANEHALKFSFAVDADRDGDVFGESPYSTAQSNGPEQTEPSVFNCLRAVDDSVKIAAADPEDKFLHVKPL